jgi:MFS family permease
MNNNSVVAQSRPSSLRIALASLLVTSIEWCDFNLYGSAAALVFPAVFFPHLDPLISILLSFGTFAVAFIARPIGGVFFGNLGDRLGRKQALNICLLVMGIGTAGIGLLPPASSIGIIAPILLVILRFLQGLSVGGQWAGAVLIAVENAPEGKRGFYGSFAQMGAPLGALLATGFFLLFTVTLPQVQFLAWGWRVPFLLGGMLVVVAWLAQRGLEETIAFKHMQETHQQPRVPMLEAFKKYPRVIALVAGGYIVVTGGVYLTTTYMLAYGTTIGIPSSMILNATLLTSFLAIFTITGSAILSDRVGRKKVCITGIILTGLWSFPMFLLVNTRIPVLVFIAIVVVGLILSVKSGPLAAFFAESFATKVRYSGVSIGAQIGSILGGAFAPTVAAALFATTRSWVPIAIYLVVMAVISLTAVSLMPETYQRDVSAVVDESAVRVPLGKGQREMLSQ